MTRPLEPIILSGSTILEDILLYGLLTQCNRRAKKALRQSATSQVKRRPVLLSRLREQGFPVGTVTRRQPIESPFLFPPWTSSGLSKDVRQ